MIDRVSSVSRRDSVIAHLSLVGSQGLCLLGVAMVWPVLAAPFIALPIVMLWIRPRRALPDGPALDWGHTAGHPWLLINRQVYWVPEPLWRARVGSSSSSTAVDEVDGFRIDLGTPTSGRVPSFEAMSTAWGWGSVLPVALSVLFGRDCDTACVLIGIILFYGFLLFIPTLVFATLMFLVDQMLAEGGNVQLRGRVLQAPGKSLVLSPRTRVELDGQRLFLHEGEVRLRIRGRAAAIRELAERLEGFIASLPDDDQEVPDALQQLRQAPPAVPTAG